MSVFPVTKLPPTITGYYPHMARRDAQIWEAFLQQRGHEFSDVAYDVAVGGLDPTDPDMTEAERLGWRYTTAAKIDVVGWRGDECWIIEVKPNASLSALGQVLGYQLLLEREPLDARQLVPVVLTDQAGPDVRYVADQLNIMIVTTGAP